MKNLKKVLALVLAVVMIMSVVTVASAKTYTDVKATDNYADAIDALSSLKILDGFKDGDNYSFKAEDPFTRAQAAKIVAIVHNAATNGAIKDQDAISGLYSNAQNPFVDCNNSWALPFINYCRITGLADGMTATTYEPNRYVTGVQFLKLMLTTLNFDTAKEGYTGTGWDVNVLNRANEVGLTAGLADGWKAIAPIKRGEAAQVLYNALTKYLVEYGQKVKNNYVKDETLGKYYNYSFISNEQVAQSGYTLGAKMGITIKRATDDFRRPGYSWSYGSWSAFYMDTPKAEYKTAVTMCDVLKVMGVAETNGTKVIKLNGWVNGIVQDADHPDATQIGKLMGGKTKTANGVTLGTALNYYAIDGFKVDPSETYLTTAGTVLQHQRDKSCQKKDANDANATWYQPVYGGQGDLTQVFKTEDGWVITTVHTFLAEVTSVKTLNRKDHATTASATVQAWIDCEEEPSYDKTFAMPSLNLEIDSTKYAKGSKLLVTVSHKKAENANISGTQNYRSADLAVVTYEAPETKVGKLTGASDLHYPTTVSIDGTQYNANCRFVMGRDDAMSFNNWKTSFTFYFDTYGNVIGCGPVTGEAVNYAVLDRIYGEHVKGKFVLKGDIYVNGSVVEDATISTAAGSFKDFTGDWDNGYFNPNFDGIDYIYTDADRNDPRFTDALYTYSVDDKGVYTLTWVGLFEDDTYDELDGFSRISTDPAEDTPYTLIQHLAKRASISVFANGEMLAYNISESTQFICKGVDGTWKTYTGYTELPALTAQYMDVVFEGDETTFVSVVYLGEVTYAGDKIIGYVPTWDAFRWADGYDVITVYVKGEAVKVNLKHEDQGHDQGHKPGVYEFITRVDENGVTYAEYKIPVSPVIYAQGLIEECKDNSAIVINAADHPAIGLTGVKIYYVNGDTVTAMEAADLEVGNYVIIYSEDDEITEIYVFDEDPNL